MQRIFWFLGGSFSNFQVSEFQVSGVRRQAPKLNKMIKVREMLEYFETIILIINPFSLNFIKLSHPESQSVLKAKDKKREKYSIILLLASIFYYSGLVSAQELNYGAEINKLERKCKIEKGMKA